MVKSGGGEVVVEVDVGENKVNDVVLCVFDVVLLVVVVMFGEGI